MTPGVWAAVPVKEFAGAKQRLAPLLTPQQRQALAAAMLEDVLAALAEAPLAGIMVNTLDPLATELARRYGARVVTDGARDGHTGAVAAMARILAAEGRKAMLTVPGDIPRVTAAEIAAVIEARRPSPSLTIVPAHDERGSNAVLCSPPLVMPLRFGDDSFLPHLAAARALGIEPTMVKLPGIGWTSTSPKTWTPFCAQQPRMATRGLNVIARSGATKQTLNVRWALIPPPAPCAAASAPRRQFRRIERHRAPFLRGRPIQRVALHRHAPDRADQRLHRLGRKLLPVLRAGRARDALVHQRAAEVVGAGVQAQRRAVRPHLHPRRLDVGDQRMQREPRHRVHQHRLAQRRSLARLAAQIHRRFHVHERQRHEFGDAAGLRLQVAQHAADAAPRTPGVRHGRT